MASFSGTDFEFTPKGVGFIVKSSVTSNNQKDIAATTVTISGLAIEGVNPSIKIFGTEMGYVPRGEFLLGDGSDSDQGFRQFSSADPILVTETMITYSLNQNGSPVVGDLSADFPTGFKSFYCMKYEITQGQFVDFLNTLNRVQQSYFALDSFKYPFSERNEPFFRMGIAIKENAVNKNLVFGMDLNGNDVFDEQADGSTIACNFLSPSRLFAYLDWAGLRPMSELEYEKACRGIDSPIVGGYAWGTNGFLSVVPDSTKNAGNDEEINILEGMNINSEYAPMRVGFAAGSSSDRVGSGNSFYGIANLSDNVSEISVNVLNGDLTLTLHGDGIVEQSQPWFTGGVIGRGGNFLSGGAISVSSRVDPIGLRGAVGGRGVLSFE